MMQLTNHIDAAVAADPRLQRLIGRDITPDLEWGQVLEELDDGVLSLGEAALVRCLCALHGVPIADFDVHFDRLDGRDQKIICEMMLAATTETMEAEQAFLERMQR